LELSTGGALPDSDKRLPGEREGRGLVEPERVAGEVVEPEKKPSDGQPEKDLNVPAGFDGRHDPIECGCTRGCRSGNARITITPVIVHVCLAFCLFPLLFAHRYHQSLVSGADIRYWIDLETVPETGKVSFPEHCMLHPFFM